MHLSSILLFIFPFIIQFNSTFSSWKKNKNTLDSYIIDILFTNSLTIIRCNPYERQIIRDITIDKVGYIKCSNRNLFLPDNHVESITLLQWNNTIIKCEKKQPIIKEERTYLNIKHTVKNAFKKIPLELTRVGSSGPSKLHRDNKKSELYFEHRLRSPAIGDAEQKQENFSTEIYLFTNRPILCRERRLTSEGPCSTASQHANLSYVCYYKIGVAEPPTIAEMEKELKTLPNEINPDDDSTVDLYVDKTPVQKSSGKRFIMFGIIIVILIIVIIIGISIYCCCCQAGSNETIVHVDSDTSIVSNVSQN